MNEMLARNQGMRSRFTHVFNLKDWSTPRCVKLVKKELTDRYCKLTADGKKQLTRTIDALKAPRNSNFANGRDCINIAKIISLYAYGQEATEQANDADILVNTDVVTKSLVEFVAQAQQQTGLTGKMQAVTPNNNNDGSRQRETMTAEPTKTAEPPTKTFLRSSSRTRHSNYRQFVR